MVQISSTGLFFRSLLPKNVHSSNFRKEAENVRKSVRLRSLPKTITTSSLANVYSPHIISSIFPTILAVLAYIRRQLNRFSTDPLYRWMILERCQLAGAYVSLYHDTIVHILRQFPPNRQHPIPNHVQHSHANCVLLENSNWKTYYQLHKQ